VHVHPPGRRKKSGPNLQGKVVTAPPSSKTGFLKEIGEIWTVGAVIHVVLPCVLRVTTKKGQLFRGRKVHTPQRKSWLRLCSHKRVLLVVGIMDAKNTA